MSQVSVLEGCSSPGSLIDIFCGRIPGRTPVVHDAETHAALMNMRACVMLQFAHYEMSRHQKVTMTEFLDMPQQEHVAKIAEIPLD